MEFNPDRTATSDSGLFGLPYSPEESLLHLIPVPWEVTTSYGDGASRGPEAILRASRQVDLFDLETGDVYRNGYFLHPVDEELRTSNEAMKEKARKVVSAIEQGTDDHTDIELLRKEINQASLKLNDWVYRQAQKIISEERFAAVLGGDHSVPFGLIQAIKEKYRGDFGILHIDAHADLRAGYQGYEHSHASIMYNVMEKLRPKALVQVGIRDLSSAEFEYIESHEQISTYFDPLMKRRLHRGETWQSICEEIVGKLPDNVYVSFDIDGLSPELCPGTGTPVPGGLDFDQTLTLFATLGESGRRIVGFDLNEVAEAENALSDWNGNVAARLLFKLCGWMMVSNGFRPTRKDKR